MLAFISFSRVHDASELRFSSSFLLVAVPCCSRRAELSFENPTKTDLPLEENVGGLLVVLIDDGTSGGEDGADSCRTDSKGIAPGSSVHSAPQQVCWRAGFLEVLREP